MNECLKASSFNQNIEDWNTSSVTTCAIAFSTNQFKLGSVNGMSPLITNMRTDMLSQLRPPFNQPRRLEHLFSNNMRWMFLEATAFNQDITFIGKYDTTDGRNVLIYRFTNENKGKITSLSLPILTGL